jgi:hypothetical protein
VLVSCHSQLRKATLAQRQHLEVFVLLQIVWPQHILRVFPVELTPIPWRFVGLSFCGSLQRHVRSRHTIFKHANHLAAKLLPLAARLPASAQLNQLWKVRNRCNSLVTQKATKASVANLLSNVVSPIRLHVQSPPPRGRTCRGADVQISGRNWLLLTMCWTNVARPSAWCSTMTHSRERPVVETDVYSFGE